MKITRIIVEAPDPVVHTTYRHRWAFRRLGAANDRTDSVQAELDGRVLTDEDHAEFLAAEKAERDALAEMFDTPPRTLTGVRELLQYLQDLDQTVWDRADLVDCLLRSPVLALPPAAKARK